MDPCWVNICEREPTKEQELWVMVVSGMGTDNIRYEMAKLTKSGWRFRAKPEYKKVVAWLESDRILSRQEVSDVPKCRIRF
jgi:hypothetical protein